MSPRLNFTKELFSDQDQIVKVWDDEVKEISKKSVISVKRVIKQVSFGYLLFLWASIDKQNRWERVFIWLLKTFLTWRGCLFSSFLFSFSFLEVLTLGYLGQEYRLRLFEVINTLSDKKMEFRSMYFEDFKITNCNGLGWFNLILFNLYLK